MLHMEQNSYNMEIVKLLSRDEAHLRKIAKELEVNHMTINRKLQELKNANVVDCKIQGKNKIYFLKQSLEANIYRIMAEESSLIKIVKTFPKLRGVIEKIRKDERIGLAIIFGSYAKGTASKNSDVDIFIESKNRQIKEDLKKIDSKISIKLGTYDKENNLIKEIEKNHVIIKGAEQYYGK